MRFTVDKQIFKEYPGVQVGVLLVSDLNNQANQAAFEPLKEVQSAFNRAINKSLLAQHPHITVWREAYKKFGANPKKHLSSIENLGSRIAKGGEIRSISPLVDLYNSISLKYMLPAGGEDLDTVKGDLELAIAGDSEKPVFLLGEKEARAPQAGEVIYRDENGAICRRWNWKEAERSKLTPDTKNAVLVIEALPPVDPALFKDALNDLGHLIAQYCGGAVSQAVLTEKHPELTLKKDGTYQSLQPLEDLSGTQWDVYGLAVKEDELSEESKIRMEKVERMRQLGIEPWPAGKKVTASCEQVLRDFDTDLQQDNYAIAGRIMSLRFHGKTAFADIQDRTCRIQVYVRADGVGKEQFKIFKDFVDIGDILWVSGPSFKTKMGEVTLEVKEFTLLSKCLHPLPEKYHGLTDTETRYRQRYLDLITNQASKERFIRRSKILAIMRDFFQKHNFLEVETPMLHPIPGGATAKPFVTHHNALDSEFFLRIAPELYLKRLIVGSMGAVYEINRCFRNEGISTKHNPEFTSVEWYIAYRDYIWMMDFVEQMLKEIVSELFTSMTIPYAEHQLDFGKPFERIAMFDAVVKYSDCSKEDLSEKNIDATIKKHNIKLARTEASWGEKLFALFEELVEAKLIQPTFVTQFPVEVSPLAKRNPENPAFTDRFELYVAGMELSNAFSELNDPFDQAQRFRDQVDAREKGDAEAHHYDAEYVHALEYAMPPTCGAGIGIDRLTMILTNTPSIKDVILFPTLKKK